ncbi:MAG: apolipoprotein N-acyltransferase [Mariniblastus sp.]
MSRKQNKPTRTKPAAAPPRTSGGLLAEPATEQPPKNATVFLATLVSLGLLWLAFPPIGFSWLAWLALLPLLWIVRWKSLPGRRPYSQLYIAGLIYWLATFYFIPIPHPLLWIGWAMVSLYMAIYTPIFVGVSRTLIHRFNLPSVIVVPIAWTGIEWIRCNFVTGMAMVCLSHSQAKHPVLIQVADLFGAYTLTFAMMTFAAGMAVFTSVKQFSLRSGTGSSLASVPDDKTSVSARVAGLALAILFVAAVLFYGQYRLDEPIVYSSESSVAVALIQSSNDVEFRPLSEDESMKQLVRKYELTWEARKKWEDLDLVVWPESGFNPYVDIISDYSKEGTVEAIANVRTMVWKDAIGFPGFFKKPIAMLTGSGTSDPENGTYYGSALLIGEDGLVEKRYFKNHLVMFGEYVPFMKWFPGLKSLSPIGGGTEAGDKFMFVERNGVKIAPSICFETTIPHLIRRLVNTLAKQGNEPDVLVNLTNDGWFYGTSCLDLHLACNVFRAVEMRKPHLVCANTGLSAEIDSCGRLIQTGPRRATTVIRADIRPITRTSLYRQWGDTIPMTFGVIAILAGLVGWFRK